MVVVVGTRLIAPEDNPWLALSGRVLRDRVPCNTQDNTHTLPLVVFKAAFVDNRESASAEQCVYGSISIIYSQSRLVRLVCPPLVLEEIVSESRTRVFVVCMLCGRCGSLLGGPGGGAGLSPGGDYEASGFSDNYRYRVGLYSSAALQDFGKRGGVHFVFVRGVLGKVILSHIVFCTFFCFLLS